MAEEPALAKVNLYLHVTGRRADGYHLLDSLVVFGPAMDAVAAQPASALSLAVEGPFGEGLTVEADNLVLRAARALAEDAGIAAAAALRLVKRLPVASGIGGGSADAAASLRLLDRLWGLGLPPARLAAIGGRLGADIPVCLASRPLRMQGVGEVLLPAPAMPACGLLLVNPGVALATPAVFRARQAGFTPAATLPAGWANAGAMACDLAALSNDLEAPAIGLCPPVAAVLVALRALPGCLLARMSGSGATCFGLFADAAAAEAAAQAMPGAWWRSAGGLFQAEGGFTEGGGGDYPGPAGGA
jgi:4-diphosphocytidyl-2-C-methyl-D-erythritol kinase